MKYVVFKSNKTNMFVPLTFPECVTHADVSLAGFKAVSAGFYYTDEDGTVHVSERGSLSLRLWPHKRDARLIEKLLYNHGEFSFYDPEESPAIDLDECPTCGGLVRKVERTRVQTEAALPKRAKPITPIPTPTNPQRKPLLLRRTV